MRLILRLPALTAAAALSAASAAAQSAHAADPRLVVREQVRDVIRAERLAAKEPARAYQGRNTGQEQTERFSRRVRLGRDGRVSVANISGDIVVTTGSGDELSIEAVKRTRGDRSELARVQIVVDERAGRVDIHTDYEQNRGRERRDDHVSVDYTLVVPQGAAIDMHSVSGTLKVTGARGAVRAESISGDVVVTDTPRVEMAKSVSGNVSLTGVSSEGDLSAASISGSVTAKSVKVHGLDVSSVSGSITVNDVTCDRFNAKSISGGVEYSGSISRGGSYDINVHSGSVRLNLTNPAGFVLNANSFSGSVRSDLPMTIGGTSADPDRPGRRGLMGNRGMRATYGDGSATITVRTFSGDIVINKR
jgi:DUF4097 and DUF4098 domain-containing protein YvlB